MFDVNILDKVYTLSCSHMQTTIVTQVKSRELLDILSITYSLLVAYNDSLEKSSKEKICSVSSELEKCLNCLSNYISSNSAQENEEEITKIINLTSSIRDEITDINKKYNIESQLEKSEEATSNHSSHEEQDFIIITDPNIDSVEKLRKLNSQNKYLDRYIQSKTRDGKEVPAAISLQSAALNFRAAHGDIPVDFKGIEIFEMNPMQLPEFTILQKVYQNNLFIQSHEKEKIIHFLNNIVRPTNKNGIFFALFGSSEVQPYYGVLIFDISGDCQLIRNDEIIQATINGGQQLTAEGYDALFKKGNYILTVYPNMDTNIITDLTKKLLPKYSKSPEEFDNIEAMALIETIYNPEFDGVDNSVLVTAYIEKILSSFSQS